jgi:Na+:H+ antiporter, NhaA family
MSEPLARRPADWIVAPFRAFVSIQASGGMLLFACAVIAVIWANSAFAGGYEALFGTYVTMGFGEWVLSKPLLLWINDGLMAVFFFVVGLEIKRELLDGELASPRRAALPLLAAVGGMLVPAGFYLGLNFGGPGEAGWGIPMATDIAFALAVILALGRRVPLALRIFLTAIAIVDDLGAVLVIALFYTAGVSTQALMVGGAAFLMLILLNQAGFRSFVLYGIFGLVLWLAVLLSGVHATVAGVLLAMTIPARTPDEDPSPLERAEHGLHPWVAFAILPIFALANAGVALGGDAGGTESGVAPGIVLGLVLGKPVGILVFSWIAVKARWADLPAGVGWTQVIGVGALCGIGFTMSLFIAGLAFPDPGLLRSAKLGILGASLIAGVMGTVLLLVGSRGRSAGHRAGHRAGHGGARGGEGTVAAG